MAVLLLCAASLAAPFIPPYPPDEPEVLNRLKPPSSEHVLGTDSLGRDIFSRMIWGSRASLNVGFVAMGIALSIGIVLGAVAGFYGGLLDSAIMRFCDLILCFPTMFLILAVIALLDPSIWNVMIVIGLTSWVGVARLVRAEFISLKNRDFVLAAKALGANSSRIILKHLLPNAMAPIVVTGVLGVAGAILVESSLSFLGLGVQPPTPTWGGMLAAGKDHISRVPWLSLYPGLAILITVLSYNLLGEGLRDALDPRKNKL